MAKKRANGEGSIRKKPNGRWEGRYTQGIDPSTGRAIQKSVSARTQAECKEKLAKAIRDNRGIPVNHNEDYTVAEWCRLWFETYSKPVIRPNTAKTYENVIENHIVPAIGGVKLKRLTAIQIQKMYNDSKTKGRVQRFEKQTNTELSGSTVRRIHTTLHGALKAAQQAHLIASNPTEQIIAPKFSYGEKQILTDEQLDVFMQIIAEDEVWYDFFYTELTTGLRRGEICGLKWMDFDEVSGTLKVCRTVYREDGGGLTAGDTKTSAGTRKIVLPLSTAALLSKRKASAMTEWIFPDPLKPEQPADPGAAYRRLKVLLKQAGLPSIRFHDLRHPYVKHTTKNIFLQKQKSQTTNAY